MNALIIKIAAICIFISLSLTSKAKIKNGYAPRIMDVKKQLEIMLALKNGQIVDTKGNKEFDNLSAGKKITLNMSIKSLQQTLCYYWLTEMMLAKFRDIAPALYYEIDSVTDKEGIETDIYVFIVPANDELRSILGATYVSSDSVNEHTSMSEFGKHSIIIRVCAVKSALKILAHEFGHVSYLVPNLAEYLQYCRRRYPLDVHNAPKIDHQASDKGMKNVIEFERTFKKSLKCYEDLNGTKIDSTRKLVRNLERQVKDISPDAIASLWLE